MTTSDGEGKIRIIEIYHYQKSSSDLELMIYAAKFKITKEAFLKTRIGEGAFEHEAILFSLGRVPYSEFPLKPKSMYGKVQIDFQRPDGKVLKGRRK